MQVRGKFRYTFKSNPDELRIAGPMMQAAWGVPKHHPRPDARPIGGVMLIDTGAAGILIDSDVVTELGLNPTGRTMPVHSAGGYVQAAEYEAVLMLPLVDVDANTRDWQGFPVWPWLSPGLQQFHTEGGHVMPDGSPMRVIGILGRIFLQLTTFVYDGMTGRFDMLIDKSVLFGQQSPAPPPPQNAKE